MNSELTLKVELTVIEDLGIKLYGTLPPVLSELISNSWDADATKVDIILPEKITPESTIEISDDGHGLSYEDIQKKYLMIGRKRRQDGEITTNGRKIIGSKGLGKLSVFGIANIVEIQTVKNNEMTTFIMDLEKIIKSARENGIYTPKVVQNEKCIDHENGTTIKLSQLKRKSDIDITSIKKRIAKHFSIIGSQFEVIINRSRITPSDKISENDIEYTWNIKHVLDDKDNEYDISGVIDQDEEWIVTGKIFTTKKTLSENDRGIVLMSRGKLIESRTIFGVKSGDSYAYSYMSGELNVEFLDKQDNDLISTNRQSVIWDEPETIALNKWGTLVTQRIANMWSKKRREKNIYNLKNDLDTKLWLQNLEPYQRKTADQIIEIISRNEVRDKTELKEIMNFCVASFGYTAFQNFLSDIDNEPDAGELLELAKKWEMVEAREILHVVTGRLDTIRTFETYVKNNAKEIPTIHDIFQESPWLFEPTWTQWRHEVTYSNILREHFPEKQLEESNRRIDFMAITSGNILNVIEVKRPHHVVTKKDLEQLRDYMDYVQEYVGTDPKTHKTVIGYLLAGSISKEGAIQKRINEEATHGRYVKLYSELVTGANELHKEYKNRLPKQDNISQIK